MFQLIDIFHNICQAFDNNMFSCIVFCDVSKAFDRVWHKGLLFKLRQNGIDGKLLERLNSYLVSKGAKIRNGYNQVPHLAQDTNGKVPNSQLDTTNESQEVSPFPAGGHKAHINRRAQGHSKHKTEQKHKRSTKEVPPWNSQ